MKVLYVEDNPANVFLVKRVAKIGQHEIVNFIDGREAIRKYDDVNPDLVLMDIQLVGETSGIEVVKELRAKGVTTPIIAVTAYAMVGDKERCIEAGCNDYLAKPLPIPRLIEIFQEYEAIAKAKAASAPTSTDTTADKLAPVATASSEAVVAEAPKPETPAPEVTSSAPTVESVAQTASEPVSVAPTVEPDAQKASEPVAATPTVASAVQTASEPVGATASVEPAAEVKPEVSAEKSADIHKVETKRITEETEAVLETKADNAATVNPPVAEKVETSSETVQEQPTTSSPASTSIHEDVTLPEKSTVQDSATVEAPKTAASTTEANG